MCVNGKTRCTFNMLSRPTDVSRVSVTRETLWGGIPGHPPAWQKSLVWAQTAPSRGIRAQWLCSRLHPGFSSSRCPPLRWQRGVTQEQTPFGMTQIQSLAEPLPLGPTTSRASGGEVGGLRFRGGNSPGSPPQARTPLVTMHAT